MDVLSGAASIIAVVDISAKVASLCYQYSLAVKDAKNDITRLQRKVEDVKGILEKITQLLDGPGKARLPTTDTLSVPLKQCLKDLQKIKADLEPGKTRKTMKRFGFRALKWPFTSEGVEKMVARLEKYEQTFNLALQVDQTGLILGIDQKLSLIDKKTKDVLSKNDVVKIPIALGASFNSYKSEDNARCLPNTRVELLDQIMKWAKDDNGKPIFWLNGMAGTGKSTIARTIAESFANQQLLGASFFFKKGEGERGNATRFFTTIATDLMVRIPEIRPSIRKAIDSDPGICNKNIKDQFEKLLLQPLSEVASLQPLELVVVIDALDECERDKDTREILQLLSRTKGLNPVSLRIFVTSRPEFHIRLGFKQMPNGTYEDLILHEVLKETIDHDIRVYLKHELTRIREERSLPLEWPEERTVQTLVKMAAPLFIFAATVCRFVGEISGNPRRRLEDFLRYETEDVSKLGMTYLPILNSLFATGYSKEKMKLSREFQEIVGSIVILESPLSINSLARLLEKPKDDINCRLDSLHSVLNIPDSNDLPVRLLHLSFREFLVDTSNEKTPFWVDERARHKSLASYCLELMTGPEGLRQNMCGLQPGSLRSEIDEGKITSHLSSELQYACRYWVYHLEQSQCHISDADSTDRFLRKHFLHWLEAISLIRETKRCTHLIKTLSALVNLSNSALSLFLQDAQRFTLRFCHIIEEFPLQIYSSALIFAPEASIIQKVYQHEVPGWIQILSRKENEWDACRSVLEGHTSYVNAVAFSPDGQLVASASFDRTVRVWEAATGLCRSVLEGHTDYVNAVAFSPDGQLVASASSDRTVRVWEAATGLCRSVLEGHTSYVRAVAFSPDGQLVASASPDRTVRVWEVTGLCRSVLEGHTDYVNAVAFSPDGQLVASASSDRTVRVWEAATGLCRSVLEGHTSYVRAVAFSPDGQLVALASSDSTVRVWEVATGLCSSVLEGYRYINTVTFSLDGQCLHTNEGDIPLPSSTTLSLSFQKTQSSHISIQGQWVLLGQQRLLRLPLEYQQTCTAFHQNVVCLGHKSGRITLLEVDNIRG